MNTCCVVTDGFQHIGYLYMENERVVVLLNGLVEGAELGPLQVLRDKYIEPEADLILILPRSHVKEIQILEERS